MDLAAALVDADALLELVDERAGQIREFLEWAAACEASGVESSLRFEHRADLERCGSVLHRFGDAWWGVVVYSCFDSLNGTDAVASAFTEPLPPSTAARAIGRVDFPRASVQYHRAQVTLTRAKKSLVSACEKAPQLEHVLATPGLTFDERFEQLGQVHVWAWRRTTNFDALARGGMLQVDGVGYRPRKAYLRDSKGPAAGFKRIWGIGVTSENADECEELLSRWTREWAKVALRVGVNWGQTPYDSADFENALCIFQEPR